MTYEEFKQIVFEQVKKLLPENTSIQIQKIFRNNGRELDGLTISTGNINVSPTIFLNYYYDENEANPDFELICHDIIRTYEHNKSDENIDIDFFTNFELAKKHLAYRLINYEKNKELLKTVPHTKYLDFAIVYYCLLNISDKSNATILIQNNHLDMWQIPVTELHEQTCQTTPKLLPYEFHNMTSILQEIGKQFNDELKEPKTPFCSMYVLSNIHKLYGASCILYPDLLNNISRQLNTDLFILPSSIHEIILLPAKDRSQFSKLRGMVAEINATELTDEEVLSNSIYYYSRETKTLSICS